MDRTGKPVTQNNTPPDRDARPQYCMVLSISQRSLQVATLLATTRKPTSPQSEQNRLHICCHVEK